MASIDEELLLDAEDDARAIEFIKGYLPQDIKEKFSEEELYYFLDVISEYYATSGILDENPDAEGFVDVDIDKIAEYVVAKAKKEGIGTFNTEEVAFVVEGELEYTEQMEEE